MGKAIVNIIIALFVILFIGGLLSIKATNTKIIKEEPTSLSTYFKKLLPTNRKVEPQFTGKVIIGHEVREFINCNDNEVYWLLGNSPAIEGIKNEYALKMADSRIPYKSVVMTLEGEISTDPIGGFGENYDKGFYATKIIEVSDKEECQTSQ